MSSVSTISTEYTVWVSNILRHLSTIRSLIYHAACEWVECQTQHKYDSIHRTVYTVLNNHDVQRYNTSYYCTNTSVWMVAEAKILLNLHITDCLPMHTMQVWSDLLKHTVNTCIILEVVTNKLRPLIFSLILLFLVCTLHIYYLYLLKIYYLSGQTQYTFCLFSSGSLINCWFFCTKMVENVVQVISLRVRLWRYTQHEIAKDLHIFRCAVQNALKLPTANGNRLNCGHNPKTTSRDDQYVKMLVKQST